MIALIFGWGLAAGFSIWRIGRRGLFFLHILQLEGYASGRFVRWLARSARDTVLRPSHGVGFLWLMFGFALVAMNVLTESRLLQALLLVGWAATFSSSRRYRRDRPKKPIAFTPRMKRLVGVTSVLVLLPPVIGLMIGFQRSGLGMVMANLAGLYVADLCAPFAVWVASHLLAPFERRVHEGFKERARGRQAERPDLTTVAVTGSYGKTSVKFAIREVLAQRHQVLATPGSYNTPMGISRVINNDLRNDHQFLVLEMGIRHPGDIAELCDIAPPDIAVVTSVGIAHLESMGSIDAIAREKASILHALRPDGVAVLNADDPRVLAMAAELPQRVILVSAEGYPEADLKASSIEYGVHGARFDVTHGQEQPVAFESRLLGRHNVTNILLALGVGLVAGLRLRQMRHAIARLEPVDHRLKLRQESGITILDDAFNSNPVGARNAVEVLGRFDTGQRFVVTPGMIELGEQEADENRTFGREMVGSTDWVVLVGRRRTQPIAEGLLEAGFPEDRLHVVQSLFEAREWLSGHVHPGDIVLYENDLPDQFNES